MNRRVLLTTDVVGGVWDFCLTLSLGLRTAGDDVVLLALGSPRLQQRHAAADAGIHLVSVPLKLEWMHDAATDAALTRDVVGQVARQVGADVVHANQFAAACCDVPMPVVLTLHSDVLSWRRWTLGTADCPPEWVAYANLAREALLRADEVIAVSHFLADEVASLYRVHRQIGVVHNGWTPTPYVERARDGTVVAGRVWDAAKNIDLVAEAARGWDPGHVYLAGDVSHPDGGNAVVPKPLEAVGFLERGDLDALFQRSRLYISAARYDPFGLLPLQAALNGCALLLSDIPSYREVWGSSVTYFNADADDLRRKWREVQPDSRTFERATTLTATRMVEAYREIYAHAGRAVAA